MYATNTFQQIQVSLKTTSAPEQIKENMNRLHCFRGTSYLNSFKNFHPATAPDPCVL